MVINTSFLGGYIKKFSRIVRLKKMLVFFFFYGITLEDTRGLVTIVGNADVGKVVDVIIFRDGSSKTIKVTLGRREAAEKEKIVPQPKFQKKLKNQ